MRPLANAYWGARAACLRALRLLEVHSLLELVAGQSSSTAPLVGASNVKAQSGLVLFMNILVHHPVLHSENRCWRERQLDWLIEKAKDSSVGRTCETLPTSAMSEHCPKDSTSWPVLFQSVSLRVPRQLCLLFIPGNGCLLVSWVVTLCWLHCRYIAEISLALKPQRSRDILFTAEAGLCPQIVPIPSHHGEIIRTPDLCSSQILGLEAFLPLGALLLWELCCHQKMCIRSCGGDCVGMNIAHCSSTFHPCFFWESRGL